MSKSDQSSESSEFATAFADLKDSKFYKKPKDVPKTSLKSSGILVNPKQKGNPVLKSIRNVPYEFADIIPDYVMGQTTCALFLSIRYHNMHPDYIHERLKLLGQNFSLRILLVLVDITDPHATLKELTNIAILADCTLLLVWSSDEAGKYIETYKIFENKSADLIMEKQDVNPYNKIIDSLTSVRTINKTDAITLICKFGNLKNIAAASEEELSLCAGMGFQKAKNLYNVLHQPFKKE